MEEDIKMIEDVLKDKDTKFWIGTQGIQAIENLIARYKELKEENKRLKIELEIKKYCKVNELTEDLIYYKNLAKEYQGSSIPKLKVQEKIEELEAMSISKDINYDDIKRLFQELLED